MSTGWDWIDKKCHACGKRLQGRAHYTGSGQYTGSHRADPETRCINDDCAESRR